MKKKNSSNSGIAVVTYDFIQLLNDFANYVENWQEVNGPDSGCGLDYWYEGKDEDGETVQAYINVDQDYCIVSIEDEHIFRGNLMGTKYCS